MSNRTGLKEHILRLLGGQKRSWTPGDLERTVRDQMPRATRSQFRTAIRRLVETGKLVYTYRYSICQIERNFSRSVPVSDRLFLVQGPDKPVKHGHRAVVRIDGGAAFGNGDHPTTQLMLKGLDWAIQQLQQVDHTLPMHALDIGTGSGVLAIAAVLLGMQRAVAIDNDPAACYEARLNVCANGVGERVTVSSKPLEHFGPQKYSLIMANLRPPTLAQLLPSMLPITAQAGLWVVSGFRPPEAQRYLAKLPPERFRLVWQREYCNWAAMILACNP